MGYWRKLCSLHNKYYFMNKSYQLHFKIDMPTLKHCQINLPPRKINLKIFFFFYLKIDDYKLWILYRFFSADWHKRKGSKGSNIHELTLGWSPPGLPRISARETPTLAAYLPVIRAARVGLQVGCRAGHAPTFLKSFRSVLERRPSTESFRSRSFF